MADDVALMLQANPDNRDGNSYHGNRAGTSAPSLRSESPVTATPNSTLSTTAQSGNSTTRNPASSNATLSPMAKVPQSTANSTTPIKERQENGTEQTPSDKENVKLISVKTASPEAGMSRFLALPSYDLPLDISFPLEPSKPMCKGALVHDFRLEPLTKAVTPLD
ncbi:hypothetical protein lerEdw1_012352 [Lerista edwardsae]|nr:hypothetical protein lerEdw1_012352 [Lerista edwardsae]